MNVPVDSNSSPAVPTTSKPPRNPVERMIVWGGIGLLLVVVMLEFRAQRGYAQTLDALNASTANEEHETTLNEAMQVLTLSPAVSDPVPFGPYDHVHCSWFSLCKSGQYKITLVCSRDPEPVLLAFTTPSPPLEPEPEVTAASGEEASSSASGMRMGGTGMGDGAGMGGSESGAGRPRRPGGEESTSPSAETPVETSAETPIPPGDAVPPAPATGTP